MCAIGNYTAYIFNIGKIRSWNIPKHLHKPSFHQLVQLGKLLLAKGNQMGEFVQHSGNIFLFFY